MTLDDWFALAATDADRRQLPDLMPVLKGLHAAAGALRAAPWNDDARGSSATPDVTPSQLHSSQPQPSQQSQQQPSPRASS
jgi:hypothetical protein